MKKTLFSLMAFAALSLNVAQLPAESATTTQINEIQSDVSTWKTFHSLSGRCKVALPDSPEHVHQVLPLPEDGYDLQYDVYVAAHERKAVYMVLVAQYPPFVTDEYAEMSLETFLNGILSQNGNNRLVFADLTEVDGNKALDFFIETGPVYFKGRAIMSNNNLYLLAMECEQRNYNEPHFQYFIESFKITK